MMMMSFICDHGPAVIAKDQLAHVVEAVDGVGALAIPQLLGRNVIENLAQQFGRIARQQRKE